MILTTKCNDELIAVCIGIREQDRQGDRAAGGWLW